MLKSLIENNKIKIFTIMTSGRTGSDYLAGCFDNINDILVFSGKFDHSIFFENQNERISKKKLIKKFIIKYNNLFKYDNIEQFNHNINLIKFKKIFLKISEDKLNRKDFLINLFHTYQLILNKKIKKAKILIHHSHSQKATETFLKDFPKSGVLLTIRDPRANLKSGIENWYKFKKKKFSLNHIIFYIQRIKKNLDFVFKIKNKKFFVKLENMNSIKYRKKICNFLNIKFNKKMMISSIGGKPWNGDALSIKKSTKGKFTAKLLENNWKKYFSEYEIKIFNIYYSRYKLFYKIDVINPLNRIKLFFNLFNLMKIEKKIIKDLKFYDIVFLMNLFIILKRIIFFFTIILNIKPDKINNT